MPIFHKEPEVGDRLTAELSGQRTEEDQRCRFPLLRSKTTISDNALDKSRPDEQLSLHASMKLKNAISHYTLNCQLKSKQF